MICTTEKSIRFVFKYLINNCPVYVVYQHIRLDTNEVFYVGIGSKKRPYRKHNRTEFWNNIISKTDYKIEILFNNLTWFKACEKEIELIKYYGRKDLGTGCLVNLTDGGDGRNGGILSIEHKRILSNKNKGNKYGLGHKHSEEWKKNMSEKMKGRKGKPKSNEQKIKMSELKKGISNYKLSKPVLQIDIKNNEIINEYSSISEAAKINRFGTGEISQCCRGIQKTHFGFIWVYKSDYSNEKKYFITTHKLSKPVLQIDIKNNEIINEYSSISEAENILGLNHGNISQCCNGKRNKCGGFKWVYKSKED